MRIYLDATPLIALGRVGELDRLGCFDGEVVAPPAVFDEITTEPARTNAERFLGEDSVQLPDGVESLLPDAAEVLGERERNGDVELVAAILHHVERGEEVGVVSDDRRMRNVASGFGAVVTGTIGTVVRSVDEGDIGVEEGKALVRKLDRHGLHMTGELREKADKFIEEAGE